MSDGQQQGRFDEQTSPGHAAIGEPGTQQPDMNAPFRVAEFSALRQEIIKHIDLQHQLLALAVVVTGSLITIGLQANAGVGAAALFMTPVLTAALASALGAHEQAIGIVAEYIRTQLEAHAIGQGWESYLFAKSKHVSGVEAAPYFGLFLTAELGAVVLGVSRLAAVLVFVTPASSATQLDLQTVHSLALPLAILLSLDLLAGIRTLVVLRPRWRLKRAAAVPKAA